MCVQKTGLMPAQCSRTIESCDSDVILEIDKEKWAKRNGERGQLTPHFPLLIKSTILSLEMHFPSNFHKSSTYLYHKK